MEWRADLLGLQTKEISPKRVDSGFTLYHWIIVGFFILK